LKSTVIVDANVILRFLLEDDAAQFTQAKLFFDDVRRGTTSAYLSEAVLAECVYVLLKVYKVPRSEISDSLSSVVSMRGVAAAHPVAMLDALDRFASGKLDFVDTLLLALADETGWSVFSFDDDVSAGS